ncbi:ribosome small subunit-dependent GTPase A [Luteimonas sp. M1R5S59]|uniref:Small ribosomal subunit biogenesis GTPase RsgA n=1 Tax=Luteimonas kalidii TaxID=3042025 RepID=A0ABT6JWK9_9GAMM|nr:ribosome small subunit-dependent GTPase A [Luteimonas kalidii]MDH5835076.1 ribosome small subunit-dependent GTPase A [Luteimonas kalidii]
MGWPCVGAPGPGPWADAMAAHPQARPARVVEQHRSGYVVADATDHAFTVESPPEWQRPPGYKRGKVAPEDRAVVGDWVLVEDGRRIVALLPRRSAIKRGAAGEHYRQQLIAANIDTVLIVCGLDGDFNPRRIERYLLLVQAEGVTPVVVLTKADRPGVDVAAARAGLAAIDLPPPAAADADGAPDTPDPAQDPPRQVEATGSASSGASSAGVAVVAVNARDPASVAALDRFLPPGATAVLVGSSGAGKSTLTNSLLGIERMKTAEVREHDARGRHTTTFRALIALPSGACLIDTPGMRELKPTGEETLADGGFGDIEALAAQCRFRDCAHLKEPGCAVRAAVESGALDAGRLANYLKLRDEVAGAADRLASRVAQQADAKGSSGKRPGAGARGPGGRPPTRPPGGGSGRRG